MENNNLNENYKNKKTKTLIISIVIIAIILLLVVAGMMYFLDSKKDKDTTPSTTIEKLPKPIPSKLEEEELEDYLTRIPMLLEYDLEKKYFDYNLDAYTGKTVTTSDISKKLLLATSYYESTRSFIIDSECTGKACDSKEILLASQLEKQMKRLYNMDVKDDSFLIIGGMATKNGDKYTVTKIRDDLNYSKVLSEIKDYKIENKTLTIIEEASFMVSNINMDGYIHLFKYTGTVEELGRFKTTDEIFSYLNENPSSIATFKHTFKYLDDGQFYYYSTEEVK